MVLPSGLIVVHKYTLGVKNAISVEEKLARILLMEDDLTLSYQLSLNLKKAGHTVQTCSSASAAQEELMLADFDLLITDVIVKVSGQAVPDGGIGLISWVRRQEKHCKMPIIAITGTTKFPGMEHILSTARQIGADIGMEKPIDIEYLFEKIDFLAPSTSKA